MAAVVWQRLCQTGAEGARLADQTQLSRIMHERLAGNPLFRRKAGSPHPSGKNSSTVLAQQSATGVLRAHIARMRWHSATAKRQIASGGGWWSKSRAPAEFVNRVG